MFRGTLEQFRNAGEQRLIVLNDAAQWADGRLAGRKGIQSVYGLIWGNAWDQVKDNFDVLRRVVFDLFDFDFTLVVGLDDGINQARGGRSEG